MNANPFEQATCTPAKDMLVVGLPVTYCIGSDRYAEFIVAVRKNGMEIDTAKLPPAEHQQALAKIVAEFGGNLVKVDYWLRRRVQTFTRRRDGTYTQKGSTCGSLWFGHAEDYRDPSF